MIPFLIAMSCAILYIYITSNDKIGVPHFVQTFFKSILQLFLMSLHLIINLVQKSFDFLLINSAKIITFLLFIYVFYYLLTLFTDFESEDFREIIGFLTTGATMVAFIVLIEDRLPKKSTTKSN